MTVTTNEVNNALSEYSHLTQIGSVNNQVVNEVERCNKEIYRELSTNYPYTHFELAFNNLAEKPEHLNNYKVLFELNKSICRTFNLSFNEFWGQEFNKFINNNGMKVIDYNRDFKSSYQLLKDETEKLIAKNRLNWELNLLIKKRAELFELLLRMLNVLDELFLIVQNLGLDPGILLDLSEGELTSSDMDVVRQWLNYLKGDQGVQDLLALMGRLNQVKRSEKIEVVKKNISKTIAIPDSNSKEEIVGIKLGKDLEHALPSELALMADQEISILFDLKYVESAIMCFDMEGIQHIEEQHEIDVEQSIDEKEKKGPMIICIDTSGSMYGAPETVAKAVTMSMVLQANQEKRDCYLINFSTRIDTLDLSTGFSMQKLTDFLKMSFYGGTDVAPAIKHGVSVMNKDQYKNADMLIISDFIMGGLPTLQLQEMEKLRSNGNKFNSLVVESCFMNHRLKTIFDHEWIYDPRSSSVSELVNFQQSCFKSF